jgi:hypothetical protein
MPAMTSIPVATDTIFQQLFVRSFTHLFLYFFCSLRIQLGFIR